MKEQLHRCKSVEELFEMFEEEKRKHPIQNFFFIIWCKITLYFWDYPQDLYRSIKWFIQRGKRGFADCDVWNLNSYLAYLIEQSVKQLSEQGNGFEQDEYIQNEKDWKNLLERIQTTFHIAKLISDGKWLYTSFEDWSEEKYNENKRICAKHDIVVMDLKTVLKYEEGLSLFKKYFLKLWD